MSCLGLRHESRGVTVTSQVALFNHRAVVFASDTIATNSNGRSFVSEKLVPLSEPHRVAIALRGMVKFMGVEATVLIHAWETSLNAPLRCLDDYVTSFRAWLIANRDIELTASSNQRVMDYCYEFLADIKVFAKQAWENYVLSENEDFNKAWATVTNENVLARFGRWNDAPERTNVPSAKLVKSSYDEVIDDLDQMIADVFSDQPISDDVRATLRQIFEIVSTRDLPLDDYIGMYFAGFGYDDRFPRGIDLVMNSLIYSDLLATEQGKTESDENFTSRIVPLAQDAAIRGFLQGFEPMYLETVKSSIERAFKEVPPDVLGLDPVKFESDATEVDIQKLIAALGEYVSQAMNRQGRTAYIDEVLNIIELYSPEELARMAEALVGIQSLRSESGTEFPTVGGQIEVLTVTRHEGHKWIKRRVR